MEDKGENKKIVIGGKVLTIEQAKKEFRYISLQNNPSVTEILSLLMTMDRPLTRIEIAERVDKSIEYILNILNEMIEARLIDGFRMGSRVIYYALTEKGYDLARNLETT